MVGTDLIINISERREEPALLLERKPPSWVPRTSVPSVTTSATGGKARGGTDEARGEAPAAAPRLLAPALQGAAAPLDPREKWGGPGLCDLHPPRPSGAHFPLSFRLSQRCVVQIKHLLKARSRGGTDPAPEHVAAGGEFANSSCLCRTACGWQDKLPKLFLPRGKTDSELSPLPALQPCQWKALLPTSAFQAGCG